MAFVVPRKNGSWEIRETRATPAGPRSTTLATFRELNEGVIEHARARATERLDASDLRRAALRAGAPIEAPPADRAARQLLAELSIGHSPRRGLRRLLADAVDPRDAGLSDAARAAQEWVDATPRQRGDTLVDLLKLADALPQGRRPNRISFPRFGHP
jgi:hypothetical protein